MPFKTENSTDQSLPEDVALLLGSFKEVSVLHYIDFMNNQHARQASKHWPLFQAQQPGILPDQATSKDE